MTDESVLIVEDEAIVALSIEKRLKSLHFSVTGTVATGEDAIAAVEQQSPDLVLMDIHLQGAMDGIEAARVIYERYDIPVIYLTAYADDETIARAVETAPYGYLVKPFGERDLHSSIQMVLSRHRVEQQLKIQQAQLAATNRELEAFSYSVSHDLRAPLRTIDGYSSILLDSCSDQLGEDGTIYLSRIRIAAKKMDDLILDLLALSRLSRTELNYEPVDISRMTEDIVDELVRTDPERKVRVRIQPGIVATADRSLLQSVCWNLIENAWKYTGKTADAEIQVFTEKQGGEQVFGVKDNGAGFDMAQAEHLFAPFHRLHPVTEFPGTGIGLATVQRIVHRHGGVIWAESKPAQGAVFRFTLSAKPSTNPADDVRELSTNFQNIQQVPKVRLL
jgi:two-component system, sensor histidine kinase and response regulator